MSHPFSTTVSFPNKEVWLRALDQRARTLYAVLKTDKSKKTSVDSTTTLHNMKVRAPKDALIEGYQFKSELGFDDDPNVPYVDLVLFLFIHDTYLKKIIEEKTQIFKQCQFRNQQGIELDVLHREGLDSILAFNKQRGSQVIWKLGVSNVNTPNRMVVANTDLVHLRHLKTQEFTHQLFLLEEMANLAIQSTYIILDKIAPSQKIEIPAPKQ